MTTPDTLERLRAANPAAIREEDGRGAAAQAGLARILADEGGSASDRGSAPGTPAPRRRAPRGLALLLAALVVGGGAAVAATDPFGWRSANPDTAKYRVNPALRVRTPSAQEITCRPVVSGFRCRGGITGQVYMKIDAIRPPLHSLTRVRLAQAITSDAADRSITAAQASKFREDLAAVPGSFFTELEVWSRYGTYGGEPGRVPPLGVPMFLVCERSRRELACQDLNGDERAPIGAGVYQAMPTRNWRRGPRLQSYAGPPPGFKITKVEFQLLADLVKTSHAVHTSGPLRARPIAPPAHSSLAPPARSGRKR